MTVGRMERPWSVVGAGFNDDGVYFTFDDTTIHSGDVRLMEAAPDLLEALQLAFADMTGGMKSCGHNGFTCTCSYEKAKAAISKALGEE